MNRRASSERPRQREETPIQPEELLVAQPLGAGKDRRVGIYAASWFFLTADRGPDLVCSLQAAPGHDWRAVHEHVLRARNWLASNPEDPAVLRRIPIDRLYFRKARVLEAILRTRAADVRVTVKRLVWAWASVDDPELDEWVLAVRDAVVDVDSSDLRKGGVA